MALDTLEADAVEIKVVGKSGQISLGKRYAGKTLRLERRQDGTMVLFDDWFLFKGHPDKGESRAFSEFLTAHREWEAVPYRTYGTCGRAFILSRR